MKLFNNLFKKTEAQRLADKLTSPKRSHSSMRFPEDIETDGTGNIIRFKIALPEGSKYLSNGKYKAVDASTGQSVTTEYRSSAARGSIARRMSSNYVMTTTTIDLYMPAQIQSSYQSNWKNTELGLAGKAIDAASGLWNSSTPIADIGNYLAENAGQSAGRTLAGMAQAITPLNAKDAVEIFTSTTENPYMEVMFDGVQNRTFNFTFKFIPRNEREQETIRNIVREFVFHRAPEFKSDQNNVYMLFPSEFDIEFIHRDKQNPWLFKISTCALTNVSVNHAPDGQYASHGDGSPFSTELSLSFTELEVLTKSRHEQGF